MLPRDNNWKSRSELWPNLITSDSVEDHRSGYLVMIGIYESAGFSTEASFWKLYKPFHRNASESRVAASDEFGCRRHSSAERENPLMRGAMR